MARRRRSYGKGKDPVLVFVNNCIAEGQKRERAEKKARAADAKRRARESERERARLAREAERERARQAREAERSRIQAEREAERQRKAQEKLDAKTNAISVRLESDMKKMGLYPGRDFLAKTAKEAVKLSVTAASAKKYFIADDEDAVALACAEEFLRSKKIIRHKNWDEYDALLAFVAGYRPQQDAAQDQKYIELETKIDELNQAYEAEMKRQDERNTLINQLLKSKTMFSDEIEEFAEIIEAKDWDKSDCEKSAEYKQRIQNKANYVAEVKAQIRTIKLAVAT